MTFEDIVSAVVNIIWSPFFVIVCLVAGLLFSVLTRFVQVRHFREMVKLLFNIPTQYGQQKVLQAVSRQSNKSGYAMNAAKKM